MCQVCVRTHVTYVCGFEPPHLSLGDAREGHTSYLYKPIPIIVFIELVCIMVFILRMFCVLYSCGYISGYCPARGKMCSVFCLTYGSRVYVRQTPRFRSDRQHSRHAQSCSSLRSSLCFHVSLFTHASTRPQSLTQFRVV